MRWVNLCMFSVVKNRFFKSFTIPPANVELLACTLCLIFDRKASWAEGKKLISSHSFLQRVLMLEPKSLAPSKIQKLQKVLESPIIQVISMSALKCWSIIYVDLKDSRTASIVRWNRSAPYWVGFEVFGSTRLSSHRIRRAKKDR